MFDDDEEDVVVEEEAFTDAEIRSLWGTLNQIDEDGISRALDGITLTVVKDVLDNNLRLMQIMGDSNPLVAEHCREIQNGLLSLLLQIKNDMGQVCVEVLSAMPADKQITTIDKVVDRLSSRRDNLLKIRKGEDYNLRSL